MAYTQRIFNMKCLGLTKTSRYRKRCTNKTKFLFCWQHVWQPFSLIFFFAAVAELSGYNLKDIWGRNQQHVKPDISCAMEYPIEVNNGKVFRNKQNPMVVIKNKGPIRAVSPSCDIKIYLYDAEKHKITKFIDHGFMSFDHAVSAQELEPFQELNYSCIGVNEKNLVAIYFVSVRYYRESDMESFSLQEYFLTENYKIITEKEFKNDSRLNQIIEDVKSFIPSDEDDSKFLLTAADENTWFFESDPSIKVKKNENGSITIAVPKEQNSQPKCGYPFLDIKPKPFKATGFYTDAKIVEDYIEVKLSFQVKNVGDTAAIITEDGFEPIITIEPNQIEYYVKTLMIGRQKDNQEPLTNFLKLLDTEDRMFQLRLSFLYRPVNDIEKIYKSTVHFEIGKNKVMPIENRGN